MRARAVSEMLPDIGGAAFRRFGFVQSSVVTRWREIVGERYAGISAPESLRFPAGARSQGVLTLVVEGAHAPMLQHIAPEIVERINRFFGYPAVARLHIKQGMVQVARAKGRSAVSNRPAELLPVELGESLRGVGDPELKLCLEALARGVAAGDGAPAMTTLKVMGKLKG